MRKFLIVILSLALLLSFGACGKQKTVTCHFCDAKNDLENNFCSSCGEKLESIDASKETVHVSAIEEDISMAKKILMTGNKKTFLNAYPNAVPDGERTLLLYGATFSEIKGYYDIFFYDDGDLSTVIFRYEEDVVNIEEIVKTICSYLGDYTEYKPEYDAYEWENKEINIEVEFYPDDGIWFELVDDSVIVKTDTSSNKTGENRDATDNQLLTEEDVYSRALELLEQEEFADAKDLFASISEYRDSSEMVKECQYQEVCWHLNRDETWTAYDELTEIYDYKDSFDLMLEIAKGEESHFYRKAKELYEEGDLEKAKVYFSGILEYEDSNKYIAYCDLINELEGVYLAEEGLLQWYAVIRDGCWIDYDVMNGDVYSHDVLPTEYFGRTCLVSKYHVDDPSQATGHYFITETDGERYIEKDLLSTELTYRKIDYKTEADLMEEIDGYMPAKDPYIGMSAGDIRNSTWGSPIKINKYTYSTGVREQWVYLANRYIYVEDGKVVGISE